MFTFPSTPTSQNFILPKWVAFVAQQKFTALSRVSKNENCIPVVGMTGAGKSTFITTQLGGNFVQRGTNYDLVSCPVDSPKTSHAAESQTLHLGLFSDNSGMTYLDTGGPLDTHGADEELWIRFNLGKMFTLAPQVRALVFVIDFTAISAIRWHGVTAHVDAFKPILNVKEQEQLFKSSIFVFTRACADRTPLTVDAIRASATRAKKAREERLNMKMERLPKTLGGDINWSSVPEATRHEIDNLTQELVFINAILSAPVMVADIKDAASCEAQRRTFAAAVQQCPSVERDVLRKVARGFSDAVYNAQNALGELSAKAATFVSEMNSRYQSVHKVITRSQDLLESVERDWSAVKPIVAQQLEDGIITAKAAIASRNSEIKRLSESTRLKQYDTKNIFERKSGGFWAELFGGGWANEKCSWSGQEFVDWELENSRCIDWANSKCSIQKSQGKVYLDLESERDKNIDVTLNIFVHEKDHPSTSAAISSLREKNTTAEKHLERDRVLQATLAGCNNAESLTKFCIKRERGQMSELAASIASFQSPISIPSDVPCAQPLPTQEQCFRDLVEILSVLVKENLVSDKLPSTTANAFKECIKLLQDIDTIRQTPQIKKFLSQEFSQQAPEAVRDADVVRPKATAEEPDQAQGGGSSASSSSAFFNHMPSQATSSASATTATTSSTVSPRSSSLMPMWLQPLLAKYNVTINPATISILVDEGEIDSSSFPELKEADFRDLNVPDEDREKLMSIIRGEKGEHPAANPFDWIKVVWEREFARPVPERILTTFRNRQISSDDFHQMSQREIEGLGLPVGPRTNLGTLLRQHHRLHGENRTDNTTSTSQRNENGNSHNNRIDDDAPSQRSFAVSQRDERGTRSIVTHSTSEGF